MSVRAGLGEQGAMLLVGPDHLLRSDLPGDGEQWNVRSSFLRPDNSRINFNTPDGELLQRVFSQGKEGTVVLQIFVGRARCWRPIHPSTSWGRGGRWWR